MGQDKMGYMSLLYEYFAWDTAIVRNYQPNISVVYTGPIEDASGDKYFHLVNTATNTIRSFKVDEYVKDVEIVDDTVYYCGWAGFPALCYFAISDVMNSNICVKTYWYYTTVRSVPRRLEMFKTTDGIHAVMVGTYGTSPSVNSFIADAWKPSHISPPNSWSVAVLLTDGKEMYDDIAVTDNYVVASAVAPAGNDIFLRVFHKPLYATHSLVFYSYDNNIFYGDCNGGLGPEHCPSTLFYYYGDFDQAGSSEGNHPLRMVHTFGDTIILTCMSSQDTRSYGLTLKEIEIVGGTPYVCKDFFSWWGTELKEGWDVRDIRFNRGNDSLLVLMDYEWPLYGGANRSMIAKTKYNAFNTVNVTAPKPMMPWIYSMDAFAGFSPSITPGVLRYGAVCVGENRFPSSLYPQVWTHTRLSGLCEYSDVMKIIKGEGKLISTDFPNNLVSVIRWPIYDWFADVDEWPLMIQCGED